jgi:uncharacterized protein YjbI with pentapeptide repeats
MPDKDGKLTPEKLKTRWFTEEGERFRKEIIKQLKSEENNHCVDWESLKVTNQDGTEFQWKDFPGINEIQNEAFFIMSHNLCNANARWGDLRCINLQKTTLNEAQLSFAKLQHAVLLDANLQQANLHLAKLQHSDLRWAKLQHANLPGANLEHSDLFETDFTEADLFKANLKNTNLFEAILLGTNLSFSNLEGADLTTKHFRMKTFIQRINEAIKALIKYKDKPIEKVSDFFSIKNLVHLLYMLLFSLISKLHLIPKYNFLKPTLVHGSKLRNAKMDAYPVLFRTLLDEQYLEDFASKHKYWYFLWLISSNCGRSVSLLFAWSFLFTICFGLIYAPIFSPSWFPIWLQNILSSIDPKFDGLHEGSTFWEPFYLSITTLFSFGFTQAAPSNSAAYFWHTYEIIVGFFLILAFGSMFKSRSS